MLPSDIENIERATIAAVSPELTEEWQGWLLPLDSGTVSRARSAVPLTHSIPLQGVIDRVESRYRAHGMPPRFRLAVIPCFDAFRETLAQRGYKTGEPVLVQVAETETVLKAATGESAEVAEAPDDAWATLFLGEGFDPKDGASRVASLSRAAGSVFASVREEGRTVAGGAGAFSHGWASVHGMRTEHNNRGRGLARRVLAGLAEAAKRRAVSRIFLQVEAQNEPALALYRRTGFITAWRYEYWQLA